MLCIRGRTGRVFRSNVRDLSYLLTPREYSSIQKLDRLYFERYAMQPEDNCNLVYYLGDDPDFTCTWSAISQRIPTFRRGAASAKFWFPAARRWMTSAEKSLHCTVALGVFCQPQVLEQLRLTAMTFPVRVPMSAAWNVPCLVAKDPKRAAQLVGNAMALQCAAFVQMLAFSCFSKS